MLLTNASQETGSEEYTPNLFWLGHSRSGCVCVCACLNPKRAVAFESASYRCFPAPNVEMFDLLAQEDQHHAKYLSDLLKQWTFKQSTFFQKKNPILMTLQLQSKSGLQVACDAGTRQMNPVILWFSFSFLKLRKNRKSTFGFYMPWSFIITKIFTHNFCKFSFLSVWHRPRNSRQYLSY